MDDNVPGLPRAEVGESGDEGADLVVGDGQDDDFGAPRDLFGGGERHSGQHRVGPLARGVRGRGNSDDLMPDGAQSGANDGADVAHADDADAEASGGTHGHIVADPRPTCRSRRLWLPRQPR